MSEYTPTTEEVRDRYSANGSLVFQRRDRIEFARWYEAEKRMWQAEALREAADFLRDDMDEPWGMRAGNRLDARADEIKEARDDRADA